MERQQVQTEFRQNPYTSAAVLRNIIERVWEEEVVPEDWREGFLVKLHTWRRGMEAEMAAKGFNFSGLEKMAQNRVRWKHIVDCLCSTPE